MTNLDHVKKTGISFEPAEADFMTAELYLRKNNSQYRRLFRSTNYDKPSHHKNNEEKTNSKRQQQSGLVRRASNRTRNDEGIGRERLRSASRCRRRAPKGDDEVECEALLAAFGLLCRPWPTSWTYCRTAGFVF